MEANLTHFDEDPFDDLEDVGEYRPNSVDFALDVWDMIAIVLRLVISVVSVSSCIFLICILLKFKQLKTRLNRYLLHYAATTLFCTAFTPLFHLILFVFTVKYKFSLVCVAYQSEISAMFASYAFATAPVLHWYLIEYKKDFAKKHNYFITLIYLVTLVHFIINSSTCGSSMYRKLHQYVLIGSYFFLFGVIVTINYLKYKNPPLNQVNEKNRHALLVGTFIIVGWLPLVMFHLVFILIDNKLDYSRTLRFIILLFGTLPTFFAYSIPIIVLILLGRLNKHFKMVYDRIFKRSVQTYTDDELVESESEAESPNKELDQVANVP